MTACLKQRPAATARLDVRAIHRVTALNPDTDAITENARDPASELGALDLVAMDSPVGHAAHAVHELLGTMWWGLVIAVVVIGILEKLPQELLVGAVLNTIGP